MPGPRYFALPLLPFLAGCLGPPGARAARPAPEAGAPASAVAFRLPLEGARVLSPFGRRGRRFHEGLDLRRSRGGGEPVLAAADGVVVEAGHRRGYGRQVLLRHANGWYTRYAHLRSFRARAGREVKQGEPLGAVGATGRASTPHLHFEVLTPSRRPVDPAPYVFR